MYSKEDLIKMSAVDIRQVDKSSLPDVHGMDIDNSMPINDRAEALFARIGNPYLFKSGDTAVRVRFKNDGTCLEDRLVSAFEFRKNCT